MTQNQASPPGSEDQLVLRDQILSIFGPRISVELVEFAKFVAAIETDFIICMARKAARLLDLLVLAGFPSPRRPILFSHVLSQELTRFRGKSVTLLDDTLILGTTLGRAKKQLEEAGAQEVKTVVFALDKEFWDGRIITPDRRFVELSHPELLSFCTAEVQAFSRFRVPYLTDFPMVDDLFLTPERFSKLHLLPNWDIHLVSKNGEGSFASRSYSALPEDSSVARLERLFGDSAENAFEVIKVRIYSRKDLKGNYWVKVIPIATLRPLDHDNLSSLFEMIVGFVERRSGQSMQPIRGSLTTPISKLRFVQYFVSGYVGSVFLDELVFETGIKRKPSYSTSEAMALFGSWIQPELAICHSILLSETGDDQGIDASKVGSSTVPLSISRISNEECSEFLKEAGANQSIESKIGMIFLRLHQKYELPARREARERGALALELPASEMPSRDRLSYGFTWDAISDAVIKSEDLKPSPRRKQLLSIVLDRKVDLGVAVPILCEREGVLFRAYRHGEDVPFEEQENALAFKVAQGFLTGAKRSSIPRVEMEKLLVSLIGVGTHKKFLEAIYGLSGSHLRTVRVGFHLHGAVVISSHGDSYFADSKDSWLSRRLVDEGVLKRDSRGLYVLGREPEAATLTVSATTEAEQLGLVIGRLSSERAASGKPILSTNDLVAITTCARARDTALALVAELKIIFERLDKRIVGLIEARSTNDVSKLDQFLSDSGNAALASARMKLLAWSTRRAVNAVERAYDHLRESGDLFAATYWRSLWPSVFSSPDEHHNLAFQPWIDKISAELDDIALSFSLIEIAMASAIHKADPKVGGVRLARALEKAGDLMAEMRSRSRKGSAIDRFAAVISDGKPLERDRETLQWAMNLVMSRRSVVKPLSQQVVQFGSEYGRVEKKREFQFVVWYDIVNSTGEKSSFQGDELVAYRKRVRQFKDRVKTRLYEFRFEARRRDVQIHVWSNTLDAKDDEKHVFISGQRSVDFAAGIMEVLSNEALSAGVRIRAACLNSNFAGIPVHHFQGSADVEGEAFWEHSSRIKASLKKFEKLDDLPGSYLWLIGAVSERPDFFFGKLKIVGDARKGSFETEIENFRLQTQYFGAIVN